MRGMDRDTGKLISDREHLRQSIEMILNTPIGSRVMRPGFGSEVPRFIAAPMTPETDLKIFAAVIDALNKWEPRLLSERVEIISRSPDGTLTLRITGEFYSETIQIDGIRVSGFVTERSLNPAVPSDPTGPPETPLDPSTPTGEPETPLDPSTPTSSGFNTFLFGSDKIFIFGNDIFGWE